MYQLPSATLPAAAEASASVKSAGLSPALKQQLSLALAQRAMQQVGRMFNPGLMTKTPPTSDLYGNPPGLLGY